MAFFPHTSFSDASGKWFGNVPQSGAADNGGGGNNITPAKAVGRVIIPFFGSLGGRNYSDVIEYNRYVSQLHSIPYYGLRDITPIRLPLNSKNKIAVKFLNSIPIKELIDSHNNKGIAFTGQLYSKYIVEHTSTSMFRLLSRKDEYILEPNTWGYKRVSNGKITSDIVAHFTPDFLNNGHVQSKTNMSLFARLGGKRKARIDLSTFRYYGSWYLHYNYILNQKKLNEYVSKRLNIQNINVTNFETIEIDNQSIIFWEILLTRLIGEKYKGSGLEFPFRLKGETQDKIFVVNIESKKFMDTLGNTYEYLEGNDYILTFDIDNFLDNKLWEVNRNHIKRFSDRVRTGFYRSRKPNYNKNIEEKIKKNPGVFLDKKGNYFDRSRFTFKLSKEIDPNTTTKDEENNNIKYIDSGGMYLYSKLLNIRGNTKSDDVKDPYSAIPIQGEITTTDMYGNKSSFTPTMDSFEMHEYIHSVYLKNTSGDLTDKGVPTNTKENTVLEIPYNARLRPKIPEDVNLINYDRYEINSNLPEIQTGKYIEYPVFDDFEELRYTPTNNDEIIIFNTERRKTITRNGITQTRVTPMFLNKSIYLDIKLGTIIVKKDIIDGEIDTDKPTMVNGSSKEGFHNFRFTPFIYIIDDYAGNDYKQNTPKEFTYSFNNMFYDFINQFSKKNEIILITYTDENGIERKDFITYTSSELNGVNPINKFIMETHEKKEYALRHIPFSLIWLQDSLISQRTISGIEILIIIIPLPTGVIFLPLPLPRRYKALYAVPTKDGFYHTGDKYNNLFLKKNQLRIDYYDRFEEPDFNYVFRNNHKIDNRKRTPRAFADRSFRNYIERPFTCKYPTGSPNNWTHTPAPYNKKKYRQDPTQLEKDYLNSHYFGESFQAYYQQNNSNNLTRIFLHRRFSLTYMLNNELRETTQLCKMAYQYVDYLCKINFITPKDTFTNVFIHTPSRVAFRCFQKFLKVKKLVLSDIEANLMSKSYDGVFEGDILKLRSKYKKEVVYLDFNSYVPNFRGIYGISLSPSQTIKFNVSNIKRNITSLWNQNYPKYKYPNDAVKQTKPPLGTVLEKGLDYIESLDYMSLLNNYNLVFNTNHKPNPLLSRDNPLELNDEYSKWNSNYLEKDSTGTQEISYFALMSKHLNTIANYKMEVPKRNGSPIPGAKPIPTKKEEKRIGSYSIKELCYWYNKYYSTKLTELDSKINLKSFNIGPVNITISAFAMKEALANELINTLGGIPFVAKEADYRRLFNKTDGIVRLFNNQPKKELKWKTLYSTYTFIVPNNVVDSINISSSSPRLESILKIDGNIVDSERYPVVSNPFLPLFEEFYKRLSYTNKHFIHRTMFNLDYLSGIIVPVDYRNGSRWKFASALIGIVNSILGLAFGDISGIMKFVAVLNLAAGILSLYAQFFAKGSLQKALMKIAGVISIVAAVVSLGNSFYNFSAQQFSALDLIDKFKVLGNIGANILTITNQIMSIALEYQQKQDEKKLESEANRGRLLQEELDKATDEFIGMSTHTPYVNMDLQMQLDWSTDKNYLTEINLGDDLLYNYDSEYQKYED